MDIEEIDDVEFYAYQFTCRDCGAKYSLRYPWKVVPKDLDWPQKESLQAMGYTFNPSSGNGWVVTKTEIVPPRPQGREIPDKARDARKPKWLNKWRIH